MFENCSSLKKLNLSSFKVGDETDINSMFKDLNSFCYLICNDNKIKNEFQESKYIYIIF